MKMTVGRPLCLCSLLAALTLGCTGEAVPPPGAGQENAQPQSTQPARPSTQPGVQDANAAQPVEPVGPTRPPKKLATTPSVRFYDVAVEAHHVVYVVDRSGSMAPTFDEIRVELLRSIGRLEPWQGFHIALFADNRAIEGPAKGLVPATAQNKDAAGRFLKVMHASGQTTVLPALKRAFAALADADQDKPGKAILLLSDGDFAGVTGGSRYQTKDGRTLLGNEAVVQFLRDRNKDKAVRVCTFLYHSRDPTAAKVLTTIAEENGGTYKRISPDD